MNDEKYIQKNLNEAFDVMAPDILARILQTEMVKVEAMDYDLRNEPLFLAEVKRRSKLWIPTGVFAFLVALAIGIQMFVFPYVRQSGEVVTCTVTLDVNPSIDLEIDESGKVIQVIANNREGKSIADAVNNRMNEEKAVGNVVKRIAEELNQSGYLRGDTGAMLVSVNKNSRISTETLGLVRQNLNVYKQEHAEDFVTVYQEYEEDSQIDKVAKENGVSVAKAAYCLKVAEKTEIGFEELCRESIATITSQVLSENIDLGEEIEIVEEFETEEEETVTVEVETTMLPEESKEETSDKEMESMEPESETEETFTVEVTSSVEESVSTKEPQSIPETTAE